MEKVELKNLNNIKKIYKWCIEQPYAVNIYGMFIIEEEELDKINGKKLYFYETGGKYTEYTLKFDKNDCEIITDDQELISMLEKIGCCTIGYTPWDFLSDEEYD